MKAMQQSLNSGARSGRGLLALLVGAATSPVLLGQPGGMPDPTGIGRVRGDFDGNGRPDLAIGVPYHNVGAVSDAGEVQIMYSTYGSGLVSTSNRTLRQGLSGMLGSPGTYDRFGAALAIGFFNDDDYADLAIGVPGETVSGRAYAGAVMVVYGSASGLNPGINQLFTEASSGIDFDPAANDGFGSALAAGDFDGDGIDDLMVGVPNKKLSDFSRAGAVHVLYGTAWGLTSSGSHSFWQDGDIEGDADVNDQFGWALAAGDFDGDGFDDAAVGVPGDLASGAGAVNIIYGSSTGLDSARNKRFHRDVTGVEDSAAAGDEFGAALAVGDFNGDGIDDLAIGAYGDDIPIDDDPGGVGLWGQYWSAGSVNILYGVEDDGLSVVDASGVATDQFWSQDSPGIDGCAAESYDWYGYALIAGDFDGDGYDDLAVGVPCEAVGDIAGAGMVNVLYGSGNRLRSTGHQFWHQDSSGIEGGCEAHDNFGWSLAAADFDGDGRDDLVAGVPQEKVNSSSQAGAINVIYGLDDSSVGLSSDGNTLWHRADSGMSGLQSGAKFGYSLAARR